MANCKEINVPSVNDAYTFCELEQTTDCVFLKEAVPCLQSEAGDNLTTVFQRLCSNLNVPLVDVLGGQGIDVQSQTLNNLTTFTVAVSESVEVVAGNNVTVDATTNAGLTTYTVNAEVPAPVVKDYFYEEVVLDTNIYDNAPLPGPDKYFFPAGYGTLTYQNTSGSPMLVEVHASFDSDIDPNFGSINDSLNWVDGAIVKTDTLGTDSVEYESLGEIDMRPKLYNTEYFQFIEPTSADQVVTEGGSPVDIRWFNINIPQNKSIFKIVTLAPSETISLKFKTSSLESIARLLKAQLLVKEL